MAIGATEADLVLGVGIHQGDLYNVKRDLEKLERQANKTDDAFKRIGQRNHVFTKSQNRLAAMSDISREMTAANKRVEAAARHTKTMTSGIQAIQDTTIKTNPHIDQFSKRIDAVTKSLTGGTKVQDGINKRMAIYRKEVDATTKSVEKQTKATKTQQQTTSSIWANQPLRKVTKAQANQMLKEAMEFDPVAQLRSTRDRQNAPADALQRQIEKTKLAEGANKELVKSMQVLENENTKLRSGTDKTTESLKKGKKQSDFWNSSFTKFSVVMSGIAATLFVFQQVSAWINAAINKVVEFENAVKSLNNVIGNKNETTAFLEQIRMATGFDAKKIGASAATLMEQGYGKQDISKNLVKAMDYAETGFVDISEAMEIATTDIYGMSSALDYYVKEQQSSAQKIKNEIGSAWDRMIESFAKAGLDIGTALSKSMKKSNESLKNPKISEYDILGVGTLIGETSGKMEKYDPNKKDDPKTVYKHAAHMAMYQDLYGTTGSEFSRYFKRTEDEIKLKEKLYEKIIKSSETYQEKDLENLRKWANEQIFENTWNQIIARNTELTKNEVKSYENLFKDSMYYAPQLKEHDQLMAQKGRSKEIARYEDIYGKDSFATGIAGDSKSADVYMGVQSSFLTKMYEIFQKDFASLQSRGENIFDKFGIVTPEYGRFLAEDKAWQSDIRKSKGGPMIGTLDKENELENFKKNNQRMFEDQQYLFERVKKISEEYYTAQKTLITDERDHWIETGYDKVAMQQMYVDRMNELDDKYYRTWIQGSKSAWETYKENFIDQFDQMEYVVSTAFSSMERAGGNFLFDSLKGSAHSWKEYMIDIFDSITRAWSDMIAKMLIQAATTKLFEFLGSTFASSGNMINPSSGGTLSGSGWIAPGNMHMANGGYLGEDVVGVGRRTGQSYELHANEYVVPPSKMGGAGGTQNTTVNVSITAMDSKDVQRVLSENKGLIGSLVGGQMMRNQSLRTNVKMAAR